tara:strand:- start:158 stop:850 length:693 start_codon:yes stop_codon:yes gene_type:complete
MRHTAIAILAVASTVVAWWKFTEPARLRAAYRLGDIVSGYLVQAEGCLTTRQAYARDYAGSIATEYISKTCDAHDWNTLCGIVRHRRDFIAPRLQHSVVVHTRLGDTAESIDIAALWEAAWPCPELCEYVRPRAFYTEVAIPAMKYMNVTTVVLVGSSLHCTKTMGCGSANSEWYRAKLTSLLRKENFRVRVRWNQAADDDFLLMANAKILVRSGGGFSGAAAHCAAIVV